MATKALKDAYDKKFFKYLTSEIQVSYQAFDAKRFTKLIFSPDWDSLELKQRIRRITHCLRETLPASYNKSLNILLDIAPRFGPDSAPALIGFEPMIFPDFVEVYGLNDWDCAVMALEEFTKYSSSEFAVRPMIINNSRKMMKQMGQWAEHENHHVRRLSSEGCRPRLPWAMALPEFKKDPTPIMPILNKLKNDSHEYVRRSVANNLNDISKDNPDLTLKTAKKWHGKGGSVDRVVKHACRTLLKKGNHDAMALFGFHKSSSVTIRNLNTRKLPIRIGDNLTFSFKLIVKKGASRKIRIEYCIGYVKANGSLSGKVFKITEKEFDKGETEFIKTHSFKEMSTRKHYPGKHELSIIINGCETAITEFPVKR
ncbi:DNA alkylation repair enzyme [hydrothermal vent metagenome]|uniref:DNA alkylation repair enzyme n=1 Tax=hydrothermal vent metagenome TaxID=652676 RepID=A0A3B1D7S4_9ZZZZ